MESPSNDLSPEIAPRIARLLSWLRVRLRLAWRRVVPPISKERRAELQVLLRDSSEGDFSYFVLVVLSGVIATFGLLIDSAATIIGAMLVAPLMSPILGIGLGSIRGDTKLLRDAAWAFVRGSLLAVLLAIIITWINDQLPFVVLQELPGEILARTRPTPIDLGVALAGGLAAAYALAQPELSAALPGVAIATALMPPLCTIGFGVALGRWDVAGGATLLFITNAVTIAAAAISTFFALGFGPRRRESGALVPRSVVVSAGLSVLLLAPLAYQSILFYQDATQSARINAVVREEVNKLDAVELVDLIANQSPEELDIEITIRVPPDAQLEYADTLALQRAIGTALELQQPVRLTINQVLAARLDPLIPPTPTATPQPGATNTPTITPTNTSTLTPTATPTITNTPTNTPTSTPTPAVAVLDRAIGEGTSLRNAPSGPAIGFLRRGSMVTVLYGYEIVDGWVWIEVQDAEGRVGWIPEFYASVVTLTPTATTERLQGTESPTLSAETPVPASPTPGD